MEDSAALLVWIPILVVLLAPAAAIIFSKRARAMRKTLWLAVMFVGYVAGEIIAGLYARGRVNPMNPAFADLLAAMVIELALTITLVWLAYAGFWFHTRQGKTQ